MAIGTPELQPTAELRWKVGISNEVLEQKWIIPGTQIYEWRPIPKDMTEAQERVKFSRPVSAA